jgi:hypothetical protein
MSIRADSMMGFGSDEHMTLGVDSDDGGYTFNRDEASRFSEDPNPYNVTGGDFAGRDENGTYTFNPLTIPVNGGTDVSAEANPMTMPGVPGPGAQSAGTPEPESVPTSESSDGAFIVLALVLGTIVLVSSAA